MCLLWNDTRLEIEKIDFFSTVQASQNASDARLILYYTLEYVLEIEYPSFVVGTYVVVKNDVSGEIYQKNV